MDKYIVAAELAEAIIKKYPRDIEAVHGELDDLLCKILTEEGYGKLVNSFYEAPKWYA